MLATQRNARVTLATFEREVGSRADDIVMGVTPASFAV
jgi:hypothetical protein